MSGFTLRPARRLAALVVTASLVAGGAWLGAAPAQADTRTERYIVATDTARDTDQALTTLKKTGTRPTHRYREVIDGFAADLTDAQLGTLLADPGVASVVPDKKMTIAADQNDPTWGLDRIDQRARTGNGSYGYQTSGKGVTVFEIDSGIRTSHVDFGGRAVSGWDFVDSDANANDCNGHGTHVAGTIGGSEFGVAKDATLVALRVLDCDGDGYESDFLGALQFVLDNRPTGPAVVNISAGGGPSRTLDDAVKTVIAAGVPVVVAAGNNSTREKTASACNQSPARASTAITVAASTSSDRRATYSNVGSCVDLFAPGSSVRSDWSASDTATATESGTSMAAPHVAGALARYLQAYPSASPAAAQKALIGDATGGAIGDRSGSPDKLLYLRRSTTGAPKSVKVARSDAAHTARLSWQPPYGFGAAKVTGYRVTRNGTDAKGRSFPSTDLAAGARSYTFTGLTTGTSYAVTVTALNSAGAGTVSTLTVAMLATPGKGRVSTPSAGSTSNRSTSITARWKAPSSGGKVASYTVAVRKSGTSTVKTLSAKSKARTLSVTKLKKNATYVVRVRGVNAAGTGSWSSWSGKAKAR